MGFEIRVNFIAFCFTLYLDLKIQAKVLSRAAAVGKTYLTGGVLNDAFYGFFKLFMITAYDLVQPLTGIIHPSFTKILVVDHGRITCC